MAKWTFPFPSETRLQAYAEGYWEGYEEGFRIGRAEGLATVVFKVLERRGLDVDDDSRAVVYGYGPGGVARLRIGLDLGGEESAEPTRSPEGIRAMEDAAQVPEVDVSRPHMARIYDYFLSGKNHFAADREVAEKIIQTNPAIRIAARENRAFLGRAVSYLAKEAGIRQFLDIGTGLPTTNNVHEVAQAVAPESRVVYVDNDPLVLCHARALLNSAPEGRTAYIHADLREPRAILDHPETREVLDLSKPTALIMLATLHLIQDEDRPREIIETLLDALPSGSYLAASHITMEHAGEAISAGQRTMRDSGISAQARDSGEFARLAFSGLELVPPGVVLVSEWRPVGDGPRPKPEEINCYGGVASKP